MARAPRTTKDGLSAKGRGSLRKDGKPRKTTTGGPGPKHTDMASWRVKAQESRLKFTDPLKQVFLAEFAKHGRLYTSADACDVSTHTVRYHLENDPDFAAQFEDAKQAYRDKVHRVVTLLAIDGLDEPIIGGEFRDQVVAYKKVFATNLVMAEARRVDPGYKDQSTVDLNVAGGVFVAPTQLTPTEWAATFGKPKPPEPDKA